MSFPYREMITVAAAAVAVAVLGLIWHGLPVADAVRWLQVEIRQLGYVGVALFVVLYASAVVAMAPATPFTLAAGVLYGHWGIAVALAGALIGAGVAFLLAKWTLRDSCGTLCDRYLVSHVLDHVVERLGWKAVLLLRLSPLVPFSVQNYLLGMTGIHLTPFVMASLVGMVPATIVKVMISAAGTSDSWHDSWGLVGVGLLASVALLGLVGHRTRYALAAGAGAGPRAVTMPRGG